MKGLPHKKQATVRFQPMPPPNAQWRVQQCGQVQQAALQSPPHPPHTYKQTHRKRVRNVAGLPVGQAIRLRPEAQLLARLWGAPCMACVSVCLLEGVPRGRGHARVPA